MHSFAPITLLVSLLATSISALPRTARAVTTTVQFTNDFTGANANVDVALNAGDIAVKDLLAGTPINVNGQFLTTSFFLQKDFQGVQCELADKGYVFYVNDQQTFIKISQNPVDLVDATINCYYYSA